jgi:excisionase family DNA binding protein
LEEREKGILEERRHLKALTFIQRILSAAWGEVLAEMDKLLTLGEVAEILRISPTTAKIWASKRILPVVKVGRLVRVAPAALEEWIRENTDQQRVRVAQKSHQRAQKRPKTDGFEGALAELLEEGNQGGRK